MPRRYFELSHVIEDGLVTYPGLPAAQVGEWLTREASRPHYAPGTEFSIGQVTFVSSTGTYIDTPFHRFAEGRDVATFGLEELIDLPAVKIDTTHQAGRAIDAPMLAAAGARLSGRAVLIYTGWDRNWATPAYGLGHPFLTAAACDMLVEEGARLVGVDTLNVDDTQDLARPVHTGLLRAGIPIVEQLTGLEPLPVDGFLFTALPPLVAGIGSFPVRAYAVIE